MGKRWTCGVRTLSARNDILQKLVTKLTLQKEHLLKETNVQKEVITQLKKLSFCKLGHYACKIDHSKYSYSSSVVTTCVKSPAIDDTADVKPSVTVVSDAKSNQQPVIGEEYNFFKNLSAEIDKIQSKYGLPKRFRMPVQKKEYPRPKKLWSRKFGHVVPNPGNFLPWPRIVKTATKTKESVDQENNLGITAQTGDVNENVAVFFNTAESDCGEQEVVNIGHATCHDVSCDEDKFANYDDPVVEVLNYVGEVSDHDEPLEEIGMDDVQALETSMDDYEYDDFEAIEYYEDEENDEFCDDIDFYNDDALMNFKNKNKGKKGEKGAASILWIETSSEG